MQSYVLITGASSGIGLELARVFAAHGHPLILSGRNQERLDSLARELRADRGIDVAVFPADLARPEGARGLFNSIQSRGLDVQILVNNAGFGTSGRFSDHDLQIELEMLSVNVRAPLELMRLFLPSMLERRSGRILNVASTAAFQPGPLMAGYYASKAYLLSFSEALAEELRSDGITATTLCPGPTGTAFFAAAGMEGSTLAKSPFVMDGRTVAQTAYRSLMKGKTLVIPGFMNRLLAFSVRLSPRFLVRKIARVMNS